MSLLNTRTGLVPVSARSLFGSLPLITGLMAASLGATVSGCAPKVADVPIASKPAAGQPGASATDVKGTPQQEAAKQKATQEGPAIQAAIEAQQRGGK